MPRARRWRRPRRWRASATSKRRCACTHGAMAGLAPAERLVLFARGARRPHRVHARLRRRRPAHLPLDLQRELDIDVVTLDTGRLFPETHALWAETERRYGRRIRAIYPEHVRSRSWSTARASTASTSRRTNRLACCDVRKVGRSNARWPAARPGSPARAPTRPTCASRPACRLRKEPRPDQVQPAVRLDARSGARGRRGRAHPGQRAARKGFASIGCAPCTRALAPGEPERNGRWWWENAESRECGLHLPRPARQRGGLGRTPTAAAAAPPSQLRERLVGLVDRQDIDAGVDHMIAALGQQRGERLARRS